MKKLIFIIILIFVMTHTFTQNKRIEKATLGSGCFWCTEAIFSRINGIKSAIPGYSGGQMKNPSYREVCTGNTGHAEVIQVEYDTTIISYAEILKIFWNTHNPTTLNRQGADVGTQYRSIIFYHSEEQKEIAEQLKRELDNEKIWDDSIVTAIEEYKNFYSAEDYHNDYYANNPNEGYCRFVIAPKVEKFEKVFKDYLRQE